VPSPRSPLSMISASVRHAVGAEAPTPDQQHPGM
jgi:hypothetical protein